MDKNNSLTSPSEEMLPTTPNEDVRTLRKGMTFIMKYETEHVGACSEEGRETLRQDLHRIGRSVTTQSPKMILLCQKLSYTLCCFILPFQAFL